jgi:hypothetical protein
MRILGGALLEAFFILLPLLLISAGSLLAGWLGE